LDKLNQYLEEAGREKASFGIEPRLNMNVIEQDEWTSFLQSWEELGATHLTVNTMGCGYDTTSAHIEALKHFAELIGLS
jgi:CO dehydrogenase/acetyl-CoA synthase epsilon subunit